jgi:hypothetical protein
VNPEHAAMTIPETIAFGVLLVICVGFLAWVGYLIFKA